METYQQLLAEQYAENAKDMLARQQTTYYDEEYEVDEYQKPSLNNNALDDQTAYREFAGARNTEEIISKSTQFEDKSKFSVRYNKDVKTNIFNIDSRFRSYALSSVNIVASNVPSDVLLNSFVSTSVSTASHFVFRLSRMIKNAIAIKLTSLEIPNVFANYSALRGNSQLRIKRKVGESTYKIVNIAPINPDGSDNSLYVSNLRLLTQYIQERLTALGAPYSEVKCKVNVDDFIEFENTGSTVFQMDFHTQPLVSPELFVQGGPQIFDSTYKYGRAQLFDTLGVTLGFLQQNDVELGALKTIVASHPPDLNTDDYIYLSINDYTAVIPQVVNDTFFTVFAKIPIQVNKNSMVFDTNSNNTTTKELRFLQPTNIQQLEIRLLDMSGAQLSFGNNFSMTIEIEEVVSHSLYEKMREM